MCDQSLLLDGLQVLIVDSDPDAKSLLTKILGNCTRGLSVGFAEQFPKLFDIDELMATAACLTQHIQGGRTT